MALNTINMQAGVCGRWEDLDEARPARNTGVTAKERKYWVLSPVCLTVRSHRAYVGQSHEKLGEKKSSCQQMAMPAFILRSQNVKKSKESNA